jgi:hypothetical protein
MGRIRWDIRRKGRSLSQAEDEQRWPLLPEKIELVDGKFLCCDEHRLNMLAILLENVGMDRAVRLGDPALWRKAVAGLR